jgi:hypothetical protein
MGGVVPLKTACAEPIVEVFQPVLVQLSYDCALRISTVVAPEAAVVNLYIP